MQTFIHIHTLQYVVAHLLSTEAGHHTATVLGVALFKAAPGASEAHVGPDQTAGDLQTRVRVHPGRPEAVHSNLADLRLFYAHRAAHPRAHDHEQASKPAVTEHSERLQGGM